MRWLGWLLALLVTGAWILSQIPYRAAAPNTPAETQWRRTRRGWEHVSRLSPGPPHVEPALHPGLVAAAEILVSVVALVALRKQGE